VGLLDGKRHLITGLFEKLLDHESLLAHIRATPR
jgi:hypothetical protein